MTSTPASAALKQQLALTVRIGGILHALPIDQIEEVLPALPIETVSQCPSFVRGVIFVRGELIPVLDASERLGLQNHRGATEPHIICLRVGSRLVGLEVDEAIDLIEIPSRTAFPASELRIQSGFLSGLIEDGGRVIRVLDVERMIDSQEAIALETVSQTV